VNFWRPQIQTQDSDGRPYSQVGHSYYKEVRFVPALRGKVIREQTEAEYQKNMIESRQIKHSKNLGSTRFNLD
jgi:hypothetical protein